MSAESPSTQITDCWPALPGPSRRKAVRRAALAFALDLASVLVFAAIGRRSHDEGSGIGLTLEIAAPFLIGVVVGWAVFRMWQTPLWSSRAVGMWATTVAVGMVLRNLVFDRGTAVSFVIVTTVVLGVFMLGWRGVATKIRRH